MLWNSCVILGLQIKVQSINNLSKQIKQIGSKDYECQWSVGRDAEN